MRPDIHAGAASPDDERADQADRRWGLSLSLLDWRRQVAAMYADVRQADASDAEATLARFRERRDLLFSSHPRSPVSASTQAGFGGLLYWPYDRALRFEARFEPASGSPATAPSLGAEQFQLVAIGSVHLPVGILQVYWIDVYGGGVFIPFRDATSGTATYGAGRYLLDTVKGADLGGSGDVLVLDFNYAYHPSCAYDPRWACPLAPRENWLGVPIEAGERL